MSANFLEEIQGVTINAHQQDKWVWLNDPSGIYTVHSAYNLLDNGSRDENLDGAFKDIWKLKILSKAAFFAWRLIRDRLPTKSNLCRSRRNVEINDKMCPFCRDKENEAAHLFFSCPKIQPIWRESLSWINMVGPFPNNPRQHFLQQSFCSSFPGIRIQRWLTWWISLTWCVWHHRNRMIFSNDNLNVNKLMEDAIFFCWTWLRKLQKGFDIPFHHWSSNIREGFVIRGN